MTEMTENRKYPQSPLRNFDPQDFKGKIKFRSFRSSPEERARQYVAQIPPAISGQGGHDQTFSVAVSLLHGFALPESEAWPILVEYGARCSPPWNFNELRHKLADAGKITRHTKPRGHLLGFQPLPPTTPRPKAEPQSLGRVTLPPLSAPATPPPPTTPPDAGDPEAKRIASELIKLHQAGFIENKSDARLYATALQLFDGTFQESPKKILIHKQAPGD